MGQAPEPRPSLDDHIRTAVARAIVAPGSGLSGEALSQLELTLLRGQLIDGELPALARVRALEAIRTRLGDAQLQASGVVLAMLVDGWLADLEGIIGGVTDAEIDPRFVEGVLVEVKRS